MATIKFTSIKTNSDLEKVIMKLRLRQIPLTLDVINGIRSAIGNEGFKLDEKFRKVIEREFPVQWQEIKKKNHLADLNTYTLGREISPIRQSVISSEVMVITADKKTLSARDYQQKDSKEKNEKKQKKKREKPTKNVTAHELPSWSFPCSINIPKNIETQQQIDKIVEALKKHPKKITDNLIKNISYHIQNFDVAHYFRRCLLDIQSQLMEENRRRMEIIRERELEKEKKQRIQNEKLTMRYKNKPNVLVIPKVSDDSNLYEKFEYGLSDWN